MNQFDILKQEIDDYNSIKNHITTGFDCETIISAQKKRILDKLKATEADWQDYKWQLSNRFKNADSIAEILNLSSDEALQIHEVGFLYRYAISPYYLSLIDPKNPLDPIRLQSIPSIDELNTEGKLDPMDEAGWTPAPLITRRYPDRLIIKVTNMCGMYCRFCQRRRMIGEHDLHASLEEIQHAIQYVRENSEIRDVLITGGDSFLLSDSAIESILQDLRSIPHVEIIRFGTRTPVTLPQRITPELVNMLKKYHPIYVNTHFNSPKELTVDSQAACSRLADAGIPLGNQMVLLNGVNNSKFIVRKLNQGLLKFRVKPYYIFHTKAVKGTAHFWVQLQDGMDIMASLRGYTSGMAVPTYIVNGPDGLGKTPILPNYLHYIGKDKVLMHNWEGKPFDIAN